jgi:hypothetical protein
MYNGKSKYINHKHDTIKHLLLNGVISIDYVKLKESITDLLTKGLSRELIIKENELKVFKDERV